MSKQDKELQERIERLEDIEAIRKMKRKYEVGDFKKIVKIFRDKIPNITIATDIICGFPTETKEQFQGSLDLIEDIKPAVINISKFNPRPGTAAFKMEQVQGEEIKRRLRLLTSVFDWIGYGVNKKYKDWQGTILINEKGKNNTYIGRNIAYKPVILEGNYILGEKIKVKITDVTKHYLIAEKL